MTQQQINSTMGFLWLITIVGFGFLITASNGQYHYEGETRNRLTQLEERVNFQVERVSRTDNNLYHKIMTDETSELVKESYNLVEDTVGCDCMFYSFENKGVVFSTTSMTGEQKYYYVDVDRKFVEGNYIPKF